MSLCPCVCCPRESVSSLSGSLRLSLCLSQFVHICVVADWQESRRRLQLRASEQRAAVLAAASAARAARLSAADKIYLRERRKMQLFLVGLRESRQISCSWQLSHVSDAANPGGFRATAAASSTVAVSYVVVGAVAASVVDTSNIATTAVDRAPADATVCPKLLSGGGDAEKEREGSDPKATRSRARPETLLGSSSPANDTSSKPLTGSNSSNTSRQ